MKRTVQAQSALRAISAARQAEGKGQPFWFALTREPGYLDEEQPPLQAVTPHESLPLTRQLANAIHPNRLSGLMVFGLHPVVDLLDDTPPKESWGVKDTEVIRAVELVVALSPGGGMLGPGLVGCLSLGLPGNPVIDILILSAGERPKGWPP